MYKWQEGSHWATRKLLTRSPGKPLYTHLIEPPMTLFGKLRCAFPSVMVKGSGAKHNDNDDRWACFSSGFAHTVGPLGFYMSGSD